MFAAVVAVTFGDSDADASVDSWDVVSFDVLLDVAV